MPVLPLLPAPRPPSPRTALASERRLPLAMSAGASSSGSSSAASTSTASGAAVSVEQLLAARRTSPSVRVITDAPATSLAAAALVALRAVSVGQPAALLGTRAAMATFPVVFPYFAFREMVIVPQLDGTVISPQQRHLGGVPESALSGLLLGPAVSLYRSRGSLRGVPRAALTFAVAFGGGQVLLNEVAAAGGWAYAKTRAGDEASDVSHDALSPASIAPASPPPLSQAAPSEPATAAATPAAEAQQDEPWYSRAKLARLLPVRKISDDEYAHKLRERERELEQRLAELHGELRASSKEGASGLKA